MWSRLYICSFPQTGVVVLPNDMNRRNELRKCLNVSWFLYHVPISFWRVFTVSGLLGECRRLLWREVIWWLSPFGVISKSPRMGSDTPSGEDPLPTTLEFIIIGFIVLRVLINVMCTLNEYGHLLTETRRISFSLFSREGVKTLSVVCRHTTTRSLKWKGSESKEYTLYYKQNVPQNSLSTPLYVS